MILGNLLAAKEKPWGFKTLAIKRHRLRLLANRLGVRQRSLYFALVTHALNGEGEEKYYRARRSIGAAYTMLDGKRNACRRRLLPRPRARGQVHLVVDDFVDYVRAVDDTVDKIEKKDITKFQVMMQ